MAEITPITSTLSCHKFASNVMETCLQRCPQKHRSRLIQELLHPTDPAAPAVHQVSHDEYGNYVIQRALEVANAEEREALVAALAPHLDSLRRSGYGKHIASRIMKVQQ